MEHSTFKPRGVHSLSNTERTCKAYTTIARDFHRRRPEQVTKATCDFHGWKTKRTPRPSANDLPNAREEIMYEPNHVSAGSRVHADARPHGWTGSTRMQNATLRDEMHYFPTLDTIEAHDRCVISALCLSRPSIRDQKNATTVHAHTDLNNR